MLQRAHSSIFAANPAVPVSFILSLIVMGCLVPCRAADHINETGSLLEALGGQVKPPFDQGPSRQYDFWIGAWEANWRSAIEGELENADSTETTDAWVFPILQGKALVELARGQTAIRGGWTQGFSIRYFDLAKQRWVMAQNWPSPNTSTGFLDQLQGTLRHGRVQLYSSWRDDTGLNTRRYTFSDIHPGRLRWDDAITRDSGTTWTPGQVTEMRRKIQSLTLPKVGQPLPDWVDGSHCTEDPFHRFDSLQGDWRGEAIDGEGKSRPARLVAARFQNGCSVLFVLSWGDRQIFQAITYGPSSKMWFAYQLDNQPGTPHEYRIGTEDGGRFVFVRNPGLVIAGELEPFERPEPLLPASGQPRTVWTELTDERVVLELEDWNGSWVPALTVSLSRVEAGAASE